MLRENCRILHYQNVLLGSAIALSLVFGFASCGEDEDENNMLDGYSINSTNPSTSSTEYSRSWHTTNTKHLSANATITIDLATKTSSGDTTTTYKEFTSDNETAYGTGNDAAYIFDLTGSGSAADPYSFFLVGFRVFKKNNKTLTPQYFISYYTGVQSSYCNSDESDFDVDSSDNTAYEYVVQSAWTDIPSNSYTLENDVFTVYIDVDAIYGDDDTVVTSENYKTAKASENGINGFKVTLLASSASSSGTEKIIHASDLTAEKYSSKTIPTVTLNIDEAYMGFYAMVRKECTLVAKLDFDNDSIVRSAYSSPVDDFGKPIDLNGEVLKNF